MADPFTLSRWSIIAAALGAAWLGEGQASAQVPQQSDETFIVNVWSDPARCNLGRARRVAIDALVRDYRAIRGCVAVRGYWRGSGLFRSARDAGASDAFHAASFAASRVGLYGPREIMDSTYARSGLEVTAVGVVGSCETLGDQSNMVMGYCHSIIEGPYLALAEMYQEP